jgi:succinate-acetate transporter protein
MSALIYAALGLLGLDTGLAILFFCNFNIIKAKEGLNLPRGQVAWFLWVAGVAELFASYYFFAVGDTLDAVTFGGFGLFWMGLQALIYLGGDGRVLGPMAIAYAVFSIPLIFAYATASLTITAIIVMLLLIFLSLIPAAWDKTNAKLLGTLQVICFTITSIAIIGLVLGSMTGTSLEGIGKMLLGPALIT